MEFPYNDNVMKYDFTMHRYVLDANGVTEKTGINLDMEFDGTPSNPFAVRNFLQDVSDSVYEYIYEDSFNAEYLEWQLAKNPELRGVMQTMLLAQMKYALVNNFVDEFSGVNIVKGTVMSAKDLRSVVRVSPRVERLCHRDLPGLSFVLKTILPLPCVPHCAFHKGY